MNYALDLIFLGAILLFVLVGVRRGFIKSAAHFLGSVIAAFLASALGGAAAKWIFQTMFRDALVEKVGQSIASIGGQSVGAALDGLFSSLPDFLVRALEDAGITTDLLEGALASKSGAAAELVADSLAPVFIGFLKVLAVIVLFFLFMMIVRALADLLKSLFRLPMLRQLDGLLGGVFGFLLALVSCWVLISALQVFTPMLAEDARQSVQMALDRSVLAGVLVKGNPMGSMFR